MSFIESNVYLGPPLRISSWRKIAMGTWRNAKDPSVYGVLDVEAGPLLAYIEKLRKESGLKITLSHVVGRAMALVLHRHPELNCVLRLGRLYPRKSVDLFFQVASDEKGQDLSGLVIRDAQTKSIVEMAREMNERVSRIKTNRDPSYARMKGLMGLMPGWLVSCFLDLISLVTYGWNLWSPLMGSPRDPFGSAMITNIGSLGLDFAFAPLVPYSRVPLLIALGEAKLRPVVRGEQVVARPMLRFCATFDHRLIDGMHASKMVRTLNSLLADPEAALA